MVTIKLKVSGKILDKVLWLLSQFKREDLEIIGPDPATESNKKHLQDAYRRLESGDAVMYSVEEADELLEKTIKKHED